MTTPTRDDPNLFVKRRSDAPDGFFVTEAAGLAWLGEAHASGGVPTVEVVDVGAHHLTLRRLRPGTASPASAEEFGRRLAATHAAGAPGFGTAAPGSGARAWIGPLPLPVQDAPPDEPWGTFFATRRIEPYLRLARDRGALDGAGAALVDRVCARLSSADTELAGPPEPVARLHGDLWSGNVMWTPSGAVLIDPAAHGGHRESDLAMLALFGAPYLDRIVAGYTDASPLAAGWRQRIGLHQLFPLLVHAALFGAGYGVEVVEVARRYA